MLMQLFHKSALNPTHFELHTPLPYRALLGLSGIGLSIISAIFTVNLLSEMSNNATEKTLMSGVGVCFEVAKFVMIPLGVSAVARGYLKGIWSITVGLALLAISIGASIGFLGANADHSSSVAKQVRDERAATLADRDSIRAALLSLDGTIDTIQKTINADIAHERLTAARRSTTRLEALQAQKATLLSKMNTAQPVAVSEAASKPTVGFSASESLFNSLASLLNTTPQRSRNVSHISVSVLLELVALTCLAMAGLKVGVKVSSHEPEPVSEGNSDRTRTVKKPLGWRGKLGEKAQFSPNSCKAQSSKR